MNSLIPAFLPMISFTGAVLVTALTLFAPRLSKLVALLTTMLMMLVAVWGLMRLLSLADGDVQRLTHPVGGWAAPLGIEYVLDPLSAFLTVLIAAIGFLVVLYPTSVGFQITATSGVQLYPLVLLLLGALMGVAVAGDLFNLFVSLEIYSIASYALIALGGPAAAVASFRYLLIGTVGSSLYLLGVGFIYFTTGTLGMESVTAPLAALTDSPTIAAAAALILIGLGIKMAIFPLHGWLPDAHSHAPPGVAALLAAVQVKVAAYALIRIMYEVFPPGYVTDQIPVTTLMTWFGAAGIMVGSVLAIRQSDIKRMLAHSTVAQLGYIAVGIGLGTPLALIGALMHVVTHAAMKASLFFIAGSVLDTVGTKKIAHYAGLGPKMPFLMGGFTVAAISMVGLPPTAGFVSKWYLVSGALSADQWVIAAVIVTASIATLIYFLRILELIWFAELDPELSVSREPRIEVLAPIAILTLTILMIGVASSPIIRFLEPVTQRLAG
jgi:multicomponent Na+:H+ antiporter subunit D